jgi:membrane dipeptidase
MRQGRIALAFATLLARSTGTAVPHLDFPSPLQCYGIAFGQLAYYRALEREGYARIITELQGLNQHIAEWETWDAASEAPDVDNAPPLGFILSAEGADAILSPDQASNWV